MSGPLGVRWGFVFVSCPLPLSEEQRDSLVRYAVRAWCDDHRELNFNEPEFRGTVRPSSDTVLLGTFFGQRFTAEVHLPDRSGKVDFLVAESSLQAGRSVIAEA